MSQKKKLGNLGENEAKKILLNKGYTFIEQNFHTRFGEIDLIFLDNKTLVFIEVKTRSSLISGTPEDSITKKKLKKLQKSAEIFLVSNPIWEMSPVRVDIVAIIASLHQEANKTQLKVKSIRHHQCVY